MLSGKNTIDAWDLESDMVGEIHLNNVDKLYNIAEEILDCAQSNALKYMVYDNFQLLAHILAIDYHISIQSNTLEDFLKEIETYTEDAKEMVEAAMWDTIADIEQ